MPSAYRNEPEHVARAFGNVLNSAEFSGMFERLVFAVDAHIPALCLCAQVDPKQADSGNLRVFTRVLRPMLCT